MKVYITGCLVEESKYILPDKTGWTAKRLIKKSRKLPVFDLQLQALALNTPCWNTASIDDFIFQMNRVNKTSLKYPIIL
ncbi:hypothetical protein KAU11_07360, partial [Candidatus Babeliales bacterium]|nr:hypothetical protein [Candidatus Babeliales bacterium]